MRVTACLAGEKVDVEVGPGCRTVRVLKEAIIKELPQLCVEGFDVSVRGRPVGEDFIALEESACLDLVPNARGLSVVALREAGHQVSGNGLIAAVQAGDLALCTLYLDAGVQTDCADRSRRRPLHHAVSCPRNLALSKLLLDRGHQVQCTDEFGRTPLHLASRGCPSICKLLLERGHEVQCVDTYGRTPLHFAVAAKNLEVCTLLLEHQHDVLCADKNGQTPLTLASKSHHKEICELLAGAAPQ
eukprot:Rhum_TRINITY_DN2320_c0_g1::Rhum_TRINITY_DN2320_c0_g1_i1::g.6856::m.6856